MKPYLYEDLYLLEEKHWWHISKRRVVRNLIDTYNRVKYPKILDVGCGTGKNMEHLQKFGEVWGLDQSRRALDYCRKRGLKNLKLGDAEKTNFSSNSFNIITMLDVLEHTDDDKVLKEMSRILKKEGLLIITIPAFSWLWSKWDEVLHHKRRYNSQSLTEILKKNNFKIIKMTYLYSFLVLPALVIRNIKQKLYNKNEYPSDFKLSNPILNKLMQLISGIEFKLAQIKSISIGTTLLAVAKK